MRVAKSTVTRHAIAEHKNSESTSNIKQVSEVTSVEIPDSIPDGPVVVRKGMRASVSDHEYYGDGTWDRVSFTVETSTSIEISCGRDNLEEANTWLENAVGFSNVEYLADAVAAHRYAIRTSLFPNLFKEE
jgi:hypothetical protein